MITFKSTRTNPMKDIKALMNNKRFPVRIESLGAEVILIEFDETRLTNSEKIRLMNHITTKFPSLKPS